MISTAWSDIAVDDEAAWGKFRDEFTLREDVAYLNHGSFGPSPRVVQEARERWTRELEREPVDFFVRRMPELVLASLARLATFLHSDAANLTFVDNATTGMNVVAATMARELKPGDEVLLNDHEYGAVRRIWNRECDRVGARLVVHPLPTPMSDAEELVARLFEGATDRTRVVVVSHVTSPTAIVFPVARIGEEARRRGLVYVVDGPHAPAQVPVDLKEIDCDFYCASCHKWLAAPFGSGFLYVHPRWQPRLTPVVLSWGDYPPRPEHSWQGEFIWLGTRDVAAWLATTDAIEFMESVGLDAFRRRTHWLAQQARHAIERLTGLPAIVADHASWYGSMISLTLPPGNAEELHRQLWEEFRIEVPIVAWSNSADPAKDQRLVRVSCHLYTQADDIDRLATALKKLLY